MVGMRMSVKYSIKVLYARTQSLQPEFIACIDTTLVPSFSINMDER